MKTLLVVVALMAMATVHAEVLGSYVSDGETVMLTNEPCGFEPAPALPDAIAVESRRRAVYVGPQGKTVEGCGGVVIADGQPCAYIRWQDGEAGLLPLRWFRVSSRI